jgi:DUF2075 family protein
MVDESHRLRRRINLGAYYGAFDIACEKLHLDKNKCSELNWIIKQSEKAILFYDENQSIKPSDAKKEDFDELKSQPNTKVEFLKSQFRVKGGNDYVQYIDQLLNCNLTNDKAFFNNKEYEFLLFESIESLVTEIKARNEEDGLCRLIAGYSWEWVSKNDTQLNDIVIGDTELKWNSVASDWINSVNSINEVGCIHTTQGYDLNYAGIIFGNEITYDKTKDEIVIIKENYFDKNGKQSIKDPIELKYTEAYKNALLPDEEHLGKYSGKFLNVCNFIRNSKGIVVIYSRFLLSGIIPIAISLEHLGYSREGATNILAKADIVKDRPVYEGITAPKYCILTSDKKEYMGNTKIDDLIKLINSDANYNGAKVKVILITPVASEGLSFYNTREIHLIEPWYHFNRADQIIGRGIRNCRHNKLNIEKRNVSVFMHASVNDDAKRESIDINAFRISTRKYMESKKIDKLIMDNAIDCHLMKNINYFPKTNFQLDNIMIETSQGARIKYNFGDKEADEPKCHGSPDNKINARGYRSELYKHLLPSIKNNIRGAIANIIESRNIKDEESNIYIDFDTLKDHIGYKIDNDILMYSLKNILYPNIFINAKYITRYKDGILISPIDIFSKSRIIRYDNTLLLKSIEDKDTAKISPRSTDSKDSKDSKNADADGKSKKAIQKILDKIDIVYNDKNHTTVSFYLKVGAEDFKTLIGYILKSYPSTQTDDFDKKIEFISECLYLQGILIKSEDIPSYTDSNNEYIGYINMYSDNLDDGNSFIQYKENDKKAANAVNAANKYKNYTEYLKMIDETQMKSIRDNIKLYNTTTQKEQNVRPTSKYITEYFSNRINNNVYVPQLMEKEKTPWGIIARSKNNYILKIFTTGDGKKTGRVCDTYNDEDHQTMINQLVASDAGVDVKMKNKKLLCNYIGDLLLRKNKLVLFPLYKPKI